ncbi:ABC transporter ATP-binding protein [Actinomadura sp. PM05-2]|uniref:ABC transporter ATP-binding protein n=1 Tax=Actinomadura parmotrematis TaxID=2864039 RepID=A0ABS7FQC2_9ACTN|nr:ABC transporter ATP-binding protein [Actinomadura parmotrematis]
MLPGAARADHLGDPTVIVDDVHVVYRVNGVRPPRPAGTPRLGRLAARRAAPVVREVHAVKGVSFVARQGEAIGLVGTNGSGKSTLLRAIAGLLPPHRGRVYTEGQPSLLGVNAALMNDLTGDRNVTLGCLAMGMTPAEERAAHDPIIEFAGINERDDAAARPMRTYSSGMAARLRFSIAAARTHDVLLIDEALSTGDRRFQRRSRDRIQELREGAGTVFLVSHSASTIAETCERTIWLDAGRVRADGPTEEVLPEYERNA